MKSATDEIVTMLQSRGYRMTNARTYVIAALCAQKQPVTIQELLRHVPVVDEASVYRTVRMLLQEALLEEIALPGKTARYALSFFGHHHHAVCTSCGVLEHVECEAQPLHVPSSFKTIEHHEVMLYGLCKKCA